MQSICRIQPWNRLNSSRKHQKQWKDRPTDQPTTHTHTHTHSRRQICFRVLENCRSSFVHVRPFLRVLVWTKESYAQNCFGSTPGTIRIHYQERRKNWQTDRQADRQTEMFRVGYKIDFRCFGGGFREVFWISFKCLLESLRSIFRSDFR